MRLGAGGENEAYKLSDGYKFEPSVVASYLEARKTRT